MMVVRTWTEDSRQHTGANQSHDNNLVSTDANHITTQYCIEHKAVYCDFIQGKT